jgi:uncharacterized protein (TIGR00255 family)
MNSMTGFGKSEAQIGPWQFSFEARSVNHRFLDVRFRLPSSFASLEAKFGECVRKYCSRGSLDISLRQKLATSGAGPSAGPGMGSTGTQFCIDWSAAESFLEQVQAFNKKFATHFQVSLESVLQSGKIFQISDQGPSTDGLTEPLLKLLVQAMENLCSMRAAEGQKLQTILQAELGALQQLRDKAALLADQQTAGIRQRLETRLAQLPLSTQVDAQRLELEVALIAERSDVSEELDRLKAHLDEYRKLLGSKSPAGRPLEFLTQELHREVNTLASKSALLELTQLSIDGRARIEKLREQIQNVE